jgi:hypothetical protein
MEDIITVRWRRIGPVQPSIVLSRGLFGCDRCGSLRVDRNHESSARSLLDTFHDHMWQWFASPYDRCLFDLITSNRGLTTRWSQSSLVNLHTGINFHVVIRSTSLKPENDKPFLKASAVNLVCVLTVETSVNSLQEEFRVSTSDRSHSKIFRESSGKE